MWLSIWSSPEGNYLAWFSYCEIGFHLLLQHSVVRNALFCLETAWATISRSQENHVYTKALLAYAFALAGNQAKRRELLESLDKDAVKEGRNVYSKVRLTRSH